MEKGQIVEGVPARLHDLETPLLETEGGLVRIVKSTDHRFSRRSNEGRKALVTAMETLGYTDDRYRVKIIGSAVSDNFDYDGVLYVNLDTRVSQLEAHEVVHSDHVLYAECTLSYDDPGHGESFWMVGWNSAPDPLSGFLVPSTQARTDEIRVAKNLVFGYPRYAIPKLEEGRRMLIRKGNDNSHLNKPAVTSFFEPVVLLHEEDEARDLYTRKRMVTRLLGRDYLPPKKPHKGMHALDVPVLYARDTGQKGVVGVGYVRTPEYDYRGSGRVFGLKTLWIADGEPLVGRVAREVSIFYSSKHLMIGSVR